MKSFEIMGKIIGAILIWYGVWNIMDDIEKKT